MKNEKRILYNIKSEFTLMIFSFHIKISELMVLKDR